MSNATPPEPGESGSEAIRNANALAPADPRAAGTAAAGDQRALIRSIIGTGIGLATLMLMLAGLQIQQGVSVNLRIDDVNGRIDDLKAGVNARIHDMNTSVNARIDDMNARIDDMNARIDDLSVNVNARIDDLQDDIRELRALIIDALHRADPAD